jgi:hypothetical protein
LNPNHCAYKVGSPSRTAAVKDISTVTSPDVRDIIIYYVDDNNSDTKV